MFATTIFSLLLIAGCRRGQDSKREYVYVSAPQVGLRDRVAAVYNRVATVKNGERLEVLERSKRFVRVRTGGGQEGWLEQRYLVGEDVYQGFEKLAKDAASSPAQGHATTRASLNMHVTPGRDSEHLFQLKDGERVERMRRGLGERPGTRSQPVPPPPASSKSPAQPPPPPPMEDWWLVRDAQRRAGWVLARMLDLDVPLEIAQYAEGQRIVAAFVLNQVYDPQYEPKKEQEGPLSSAPSSPAVQLPPPGAPPASTAAQAAPDPHRVPQYLVLMTEPRDGLPFDYNQLRVFTWNIRRHRYETAYRERNFAGILPVTVGSEEFEKEGTLPTFTVHIQDTAGQVQPRKYKLNGPIVRRVLAPGEQPRASAAARPPCSHAVPKRRRR